jgi:hypothetical protein
MEATAFGSYLDEGKNVLSLNSYSNELYLSRRKKVEERL